MLSLMAEATAAPLKSCEEPARSPRSRVCSAVSEKLLLALIKAWSLANWSPKR